MLGEPVSCTRRQAIQSLWAGYGEVVRIVVLPSEHVLVLKSVAPPADGRGLSLARKLRSYEVEAEFYERIAAVLCERGGVAIATPLDVRWHMRARP